MADQAECNQLTLLLFKGLTAAALLRTTVIQSQQIYVVQCFKALMRAFSVLTKCIEILCTAAGNGC